MIRYEKGIGSLLSQLQPLHVGRQLVRQLLATGLDGKVFLGTGDLGLAGVAILGDQVAGEAGEVEVVYLLNCAFAPNDRFARARKVMVGCVT